MQMLGQSPRAGSVAATARVLLMAAACAAATALSLSQWRIAGIGSPIWWPTVGMAVLIMVRSPQRWWPALLAGFVVGYAAGNRAFNTWTVAATYISAGVVELVVASAVLVGGTRRAASYTRTPADALRFAAAIVASIAVGSGLLTIGATLDPNAGDSYAFLPGYVVSHAIGILVVAPLLLPARPGRRISAGRVAEFALLLAATAVTAAGAFVFPFQVRPFVVLLPVVWASIRLDAARATIVTAAAAALVAYGTAHDLGALSTGGSAADRQLTAQLFIATIAVSCLALVLITRHRELLAERVRDSENTLRVAVRDALVGMYSIRFDVGHVGEIRDANGVLSDMLGYTPGELDGLHCRVLGLGPDAATACTPGEIAEFDAWIEAFARGEPPSFRRETPFYRKDGQQRWVEVSANRVHPTRQPPFALVHVHDLTGRVEQQRRLEQMALHDALTGLANRALLFQEAARGLGAATGRVGLLFVDLDGFKSINDTYGHAAGDAVLIDVARRLAAAVRPGDTVARLGGDEFAILCAAVSDPGELGGVADRIRAALADPVLVEDGAAIAVHASIGAAVSDPAGDPPGRAASRDAGRIRDADSLVRAADAAMYAEKHRLGRRYVVSADE